MEKWEKILFRVVIILLTICLILALFELSGGKVVIDFANKAEAEVKNISVTGYSNSADYSDLMNECLDEGGKHALLMGELYEEQRNLKIQDLGLPYDKTYYFQQYRTAEEIKEAMRDKQRGYTDAELKLLAQVINAEAGCDWFPDWVQQAVASVVVNRVRSDKYPDTINGVIYQKGQYGCVSNGSIKNYPTKKCFKNAQYVLDHGTILPIGVVGQSGAVQGKIYTSYYDSILGTTTYFCY